MPELDKSDCIGSTPFEGVMEREENPHCGFRVNFRVSVVELGGNGPVIESSGYVASESIPLDHKGNYPQAILSLLELSDADETGSNGEERSREIPRGKVVPLNSRRLTSSHLKQALELLVTGSADQLHQVIEGNLESDRHVEAANVQVVV